jgi:hypothetical protein
LSRQRRSCSLRTSFSFSLWGLAIIRVVFLVGGFFSWNEKAGRNTARPGKWSLGCG